MGRYDDISEDRLRSQILGFAELVRRLDQQGLLLERSPTLLRVLGELRRMLFAYEVRNTRRDEPPERHPRSRDRDPASGGAAELEDEGWLGESLRIVEEALERERELLDELDRGDPD